MISFFCFFLITLSLLRAFFVFRFLTSLSLYSFLMIFWGILHKTLAIQKRCCFFFHTTLRASLENAVLSPGSNSFEAVKTILGYFVQQTIPLVKMGSRRSATVYPWLIKSQSVHKIKLGQNASWISEMKLFSIIQCLT